MESYDLADDDDDEDETTTNNIIDKNNQEDPLLITREVVFDEDPNQNDGFVCLKCGKRYVTKGALGRHLRFVCNLEPKYNCPKCDFKSHFEFGVTNHLKMCKGVSKFSHDKFICKTCGKRYFNELSLTSHIRYKCGKDPQFKCQYCSFKSHFNYNVTRHMKTCKSNVKM